MEILLPVIILGSLGIIFGLWLAFAQRLFALEKDGRIEHIFSLLPGANCGACGRAGCYGLAEALAKGEVKTIGCPLADSEHKGEIATVLGIEAKEELKQIATLICGGGKRAKDKFKYHGPQDCNIANLVMGGPKACPFGCTGFGSCVEVCPTGAVSMGEDNLPRIDAEKCIGCNKCVKLCPAGVLVLTPAASQYHIMCNSKDKGPEAIKACKAGCIACAKCVKACPYQAITLKENLAVIDYTKCTDCGECIKVCPTKAIGKR